MTYPLLDEDRGRDELGYDARGNRTLLRRTLDGYPFSTTYAYDGDDKLVSATYPDGQTVAFTRDAGSQVTAVPGVLSAVTYTPAGQVATLVHENGVTEAFTVDAALRPTGGTLAGAAGKYLDWSVTYDREDHVLSVADRVTRAGHPSHAATYAYDAYYRLVSASLGAGDAAETLTYAYDALDNLTARTSSLGAGSPAHSGAYTYGAGGAGPNAATTVGATSYTFDAAGFATGRGDTAFVWDNLGRLTEAAPATGELSESAYGPERTRVLKTEGGGVSYYPAPDVVVRDGVTSVYVRVGRRVVARLGSDALAAELLPDANGDGRVDIADAWLGRGAPGRTPMRLLRAAARRLLFAAEGPVTHLHEDARGSLIAATDAAGALVAERTFYPFGRERGPTGWVDALGFTGKELDPTSGLVHFPARDLDLLSGRWTAVDPFFAVLGGDNVTRLGEATAGYAYAANNPVAFVDPTGEVIISALFLKPVRKKILPYRGRGGAKKSSGSGAAEGTATKAGKPSKRDRLRERKAEVAHELARTEDSLSKLPDTAGDTTPIAGIVEKLRGDLSTRRDQLNTEAQRLDRKLERGGSSAAVLVAVFESAVYVTGASVGLGLALSSQGYFDEDGDGGGDGSALFGGGGSQ